MADKAAQKARKRLKREKKRQEIRRSNSISPYKRAAEGELLDCRMNADWYERGLATIFILRRVPGNGSLVLGSFLVDIWCAGLKNSWAQMDVTREQFNDLIERNDANLGLDMRRCDLAEAAAVVAGGIKFARQNGFRLPSHYERWIRLLGEVNPNEADVSDWGKDGKLLWCAPLSDLKNRLIGCTVKQFLAREDVEYIAEVGESFDDRDAGFEEEDPQVSARLDEFTKGIDLLAAECNERIEAWCDSREIEPSPFLPIAIQTLLTAMMQSAVGGESRGQALIDQVIQSCPQATRAKARDAFIQIRRFDRDTGGIHDLVDDLYDLLDQLGMMGDEDAETG